MSKKNKNTKKSAPKKSVLWGIISTCIVMALVLGLRGLGDKKDTDFTSSNGGNSTTQTDSGNNVLAGNKDKDKDGGTQDGGNSGALDTTSVYYADIVIRNYGTVTVRLDQTAAPKTVENFMSLAQRGFYDGLTFHRIIEGFMIQGGDPKGNGTGGSENTIKGEFSINGVENGISHLRGVISMARNSISYDSASSQFFIVHQDSTYLDNQYAAFGKVTKGMEVVDAIAEKTPVVDDNGTVLPEKQPKIKSIKIVE